MPLRKISQLVFLVAIVTWLAMLNHGFAHANASKSARKSAKSAAKSGANGPDREARRHAGHNGKAVKAARAVKSATPKALRKVTEDAGSQRTRGARTALAPGNHELIDSRRQRRGRSVQASMRRDAADDVEIIKVGNRQARAGRAKYRLVKRGGRTIRLALVPRVIVPAKPSIGKTIGLHSVEDPLDLRSSVAVVADPARGEVMFEKNPEAVLPIASISKLMTAMVVLDRQLPMAEMLEVTEADLDHEKNSRSKLRPGTRLTRGEMLQLALMASENRAASALARNYPGGLPAFINAMNQKAQMLTMRSTAFSDPTGLSSSNVSSGQDLVKLVKAASEYPTIRQFSTASELTVDTGLRVITFRNTNRLIESSDWQILVSKTGYITEAGNCLVMNAKIEGRPVIIVLLDAEGRSARFGDAQRLRHWLESASPVRVRMPPNRNAAPIHARAAF